MGFGTNRCEQCGSSLGYVPELAALRVCLDGSSPEVLHDAGRTWWRCLNAAWGCNWLVQADEGGMWCRSCRLTRGRPDVGRPEAMDAWVSAEAEKRRLVHQLGTLGLPIEPPSQTDPQGVVFDLVYLPGERALTGHRDGVITIDLAEIDDRHRDEMRHRLDEQYRTVIGHLRHEVGHHYWVRLVGQTEHVAEFRRLFGDERADYNDAIAEHYSSDGRQRHHHRHISHYAGSHPLEDWAETFAHYLHILDATGTAAAYHLEIHDHQSADEATFGEVVESWKGIAEGINAVAESLGNPAIYPFELSEPVVDKLAFVHDRVADHTARIHFNAASP